MVPSEKHIGAKAKSHGHRSLPSHLSSCGYENVPHPQAPEPLPVAGHLHLGSCASQRGGGGFRPAGQPATQPAT